MTDSDKVEEQSVVNLDASPMSTEVEVYHPLSRALRSKKFEGTPPSDLNEARVPVLTTPPNAQHIHTEKEETQSKKVNTILDDIAAINKLFGE